MINVNMDKARDIHRDNIRAARNSKLAAKDVDFMRAAEAGDTDAQATVAAEKQALRDATSAAAIDAATNGEMPMIPPTIKNLEIIKECNSEKELINCLENRHEEAIKPILPKIYKDSAGNWNILMPDDDGYHEL